MNLMSAPGLSFYTKQYSNTTCIRINIVSRVWGSKFVVRKGFYIMICHQVYPNAFGVIGMTGMAVIVIRASVLCAVVSKNPRICRYVCMSRTGILVFRIGGNTVYVCTPRPIFTHFPYSCTIPPPILSAHMTDHLGIWTHRVLFNLSK